MCKSGRPTKIGPGREEGGSAYIELGAQGGNGGVESDELEAEEVVTVLDALGDSDGLDAFVLDLGKL